MCISHFRQLSRLLKILFFFTVLLLETNAQNWSIRHYPASGFEFNSVSITWAVTEKESCWHSFWVYTLKYRRPKYSPKDILFLSVPLMNFYKISLNQSNKVNIWRQLGKIQVVLNSGKKYTGQCTAFGNSSLSQMQCTSSTSHKCLELLKTIITLMSLVGKPLSKNLSATKIILFFRTYIYQTSHNSKDQETDLHLQLLLTDFTFFIKNVSQKRNFRYFFLVFINKLVNETKHITQGK